MMSTTNAFPEICELGIRIDPTTDEDGDISCLAEFRLYKGDIPVGDEECELNHAYRRVRIPFVNAT